MSNIKLSEQERFCLVDSLEFTLSHMKNSPSGDGSAYSEGEKWGSIKILMNLIDKFKAQNNKEVKI